MMQGFALVYIIIPLLCRVRRRRAREMQGFWGEVAMPELGRR